MNIPKPTCAGVVFCTAMAVVACSSDEAPESRQPVRIMLMFQEQEPGVDPYATRMLITDEYVRMDDGHNASDFVLYNRAEEIIYSVAHGTRRILVIPPKAVVSDSPIALEMDAQRSEHPNAPPIGGVEPVQYSLKVNEQVCSNVMVVPGMLDSAVAALREFRRTLAGQHAENLPKTPVAMLDPCFVAYHVYAPARHLQYGFPVQQWDSDGSARALVSYDISFDIDPALFELPQDYGRVGMGGAPAGGKGSVSRPSDA